MHGDHGFSDATGIATVPVRFSWLGTQPLQAKAKKKNQEIFSHYLPAHFWFLNIPFILCNLSHACEKQLTAIWLIFFSFRKSLIVGYVGCRHA
jgi:hypothetical protein